MEPKWVKIVRERFEEENGILELSWKEIREDNIPDIIEACQRVQNQIKELWLRDNNIGAEGAKHLSVAKSPNLSAPGNLKKQ